VPDPTSLGLAGRQTQVFNLAWPSNPRSMSLAWLPGPCVWVMLDPGIDLPPDPRVLGRHGYQTQEA